MGSARRGSNPLGVASKIITIGMRCVRKGWLPAVAVAAAAVAAAACVGMARLPNDTPATASVVVRGCLGPRGLATWAPAAAGRAAQHLGGQNWDALVAVGRGVNRFVR